MTDTLDHLLDAANDLIRVIEDVKSDAEEVFSLIGGGANSVEESIRDLTRHAAYLAERIERAARQAPHEADPVIGATVLAIDNLLKLLTEAKEYFAKGESLAAFGTLVLFDEHAEDLRAAFRLCRMQQRRSGR